MPKYLPIIMLLACLTATASHAAEAVLPITVRIISYEDYKRMQNENNDEKDLQIAKAIKTTDPYAAQKQALIEYGVYYDMSGNPISERWPPSTIRYYQ